MLLHEIQSPGGVRYQLQEMVHTSDCVQCYIGSCQEGARFIKIIAYGDQPGKERQLMQLWAKREADTMLRMSRCTPYTPKLYDHWDDRHRGVYVLVMQKLPGVTLSKWLEEHPLQNPNGKTLFVRNLILWQVAEILLTVHRKIPGLSHRDIKPENILLDRDAQGHYRAYLIDFGTAGQNFTIGGGSDGYQAPEQLSHLGGSRSRIDVFALGMLWHRMLSDIPAQQTRWEFEEGETGDWESRPTLPQWVLDDRNGSKYQRLFEKMTAYDPEQRAGLQLICEVLKVSRK